MYRTQIIGEHERIKNRNGSKVGVLLQYIYFCMATHFSHYKFFMNCLIWVPGGGDDLKQIADRSGRNAIYTSDDFITHHQMIALTSSDDCITHHQMIALHIIR